MTEVACVYYLFSQSYIIMSLQIDMNSHLEDQGPFDLILHKVTALYAQALNNNQKVIFLSIYLSIYISNTLSPLGNSLQGNMLPI